LLLLFLFLLLTACSKKGVVLEKTFLYQDSQLKTQKEQKLTRGDSVSIEKCSEKACKVEYMEKIQGFVPKKTLYFGNPQVVTFVQAGELKKEPDLLAPVMDNVEQGTRGYLLKESKVWSLVDLKGKRGWVLMENLFKGTGPFEVGLTKARMILKFNANWFIPYLSGERFFSPDKAFDDQEKSFAIVEKDETITVHIKNIENENDRYKLIYQPPKSSRYQNLALPDEITILFPEQKTLSLKGETAYSFQGGKLQFKVSKAEKKWVFLNGFLINIVQ
jgi:SH3-like domain-containing protein